MISRPDLSSTLPCTRWGADHHAAQNLRPRRAVLRCRHRIDNHPGFSHAIEDRNVVARLLCIANDIKAAQIVDPLLNLGCIVNVGWRTEGLYDLRYRNTGDLSTRSGKRRNGCHKKFLRLYIRTTALPTLREYFCMNFFSDLVKLS